METQHISEYDQHVAERIRRRLPAKMFDVHMHLAHVDHLDPVPPLFASGVTEFDLGAWRAHTAAQTDDARVSGSLCTPFPTKNGDLDEANSYVASQINGKNEYRMTVLVSPNAPSAQTEALLDRGIVAGFKPYHCYAQNENTFNSEIGDFLPEWAWQSAHDRGLLILLHMVKDGAIDDPSNQRYIREHCTRYPNAQLVLAHAARGFHADNTVDGIRSLRGLENVWFDTSAICEAAPIAAILSEFGPGRLMWGSDFPVSTMQGRAVSIGTGFSWITADRFDWSTPDFFGQPVLVGLESLKAVIDAADQIGLNEKDFADVFYGNAVRLVGLETAQETMTRDLYERAKTLLPGGTQLLSKRPEQFAPNQWPAYFSQARGCEVWDVDGRHYYDLSTHGIGATLLGFRDPDVTRAVQRRVALGSYSTQSSPDEVELAELLCEIHPWAEQVRYARTGGEIMTVAVRIARATTDRSVVAVSGYHGWHDWYLAANLGNEDSLRGLLLPGLDPLGVPRELRGTNFTFQQNDRAAFDAIMDEHGDRLAAVVMEPCRNTDPEPGFLEHVKRRAHQAGALLIFDEITIGWRLVLGGAHLRLGVTPDIAVFAKSIGNGHPMAAVIGTKEAMEGAHTSFISSTYWTEGVGPAAALATLHKMRRTDIPAHAERVGRRVQKEWRRLAEKHGLPIDVPDHYPALAHFVFEHDQAQALKTLFIQKMLQRGFLASNAMYTTLAHTDEIVDRYVAAVDEAFAEIAEIPADGDVEAFLNGPVAHTGFRRLL